MGVRPPSANIVKPPVNNVLAERELAEKRRKEAAAKYLAQAQGKGYNPANPAGVRAHTPRGMAGPALDPPRPAGGYGYRGPSPINVPK